MTIPTNGYILSLWGITVAYRATALAYMQRENLTEVENSDGNKYTLEQIKSAIIKPNYEN